MGEMIERDAILEEAAKVADFVENGAAAEVRHYDSYGGPELSGRKTEVCRRDVAGSIAKAIRALKDTPPS